MRTDFTDFELKILRKYGYDYEGIEYKNGEYILILGIELEDDNRAIYIDEDEMLVICEWLDFFDGYSKEDDILVYNEFDDFRADTGHFISRRYDTLENFIYALTIDDKYQIIDYVIKKLT